MTMLRVRQTATSSAPMPNARPWRRRQRPAAAQRCAEGAGLDGVDRGRSTISCAVHRTSDMLTTSLTRADASMSTFTTPRIYTCLTDATLANYGSLQGIAVMPSRNVPSGWQRFRLYRQEPVSIPRRRHGNWKHGNYSKQRIEDRREARLLFRILRHG